MAFTTSTFVKIVTSDTVTHKSRVACTFEVAWDVGAGGVSVAMVGFLCAFVKINTCDTVASVKWSFTGTSVAAYCIFTDSTWTVAIVVRTLGAFVDVGTCHAITFVAGIACANVTA